LKKLKLPKGPNEEWKKIAVDLGNECTLTEDWENAIFYYEIVLALWKQEEDVKKKLNFCKEQRSLKAIVRNIPSLSPIYVHRTDTQGVALDPDADFTGAK